MDWRSELSNNERLRYVGVLIQALKELALITNNNNNNTAPFDIAKLKSSAEEFEKYCYKNASNRISYVHFFKQKILSIKNSIQQQNLKKQQQGMATGSMNIQQINQQQSPQMSQNIPQQVMNTGNQLNQNQMNTNNQNSNQAFLAQQSQVRQQNAQMRVNQQQSTNLNKTFVNNNNFNQGNQSNIQPAQTNNAAPAQQQANNMAINIKTIPIPNALLQRIPSLPPNVNTWQQIFDLVNSRQIDKESIGAIRQAYSIHSQLIQKQQQQQQQQQAQQQQQKLNQNSFNTANNKNTSQSSNTNVAGNDLNAQFSVHQQDLRNRNQLNQNQNPNPIQQAQSQTLGQQQQTSAAQNSAPMPPITPEMYQRLTANGIQLLQKLQQEKQIPANLTNEQKNLFIKRYIHRQQQIRAEQQAAAAVGGGGNGSTNASNNSAPKAAQPIQPLPNAQQSAQFNQQNWNNNTAESNNNANLNADSSLNMQNLNAQQLNARRQQVLMMQQQQAQRAAGQQQQTQIPNAPQGSTAPVNSGNISMNNNIAGPQNSGTGALKNNMLVPTEQDRVDLRMFLNEVSKVPIKLTNLTNQLTDEQKKIVSSKTHSLLLPLFNLIEQLVPIFYALTKNVDGTKKLLHMRFMVKEVLDGLARHEYYASPELLEKVKAQSQKYVSFVKEQINRRNAGLGGPQQQQPQSNATPGNQQNNNSNASMNINPQITPQQLLQIKQQNVNPQLTPQQLLQRQQQQQQQQQRSLSGLQQNNNPPMAQFVYNNNASGGNTTNDFNADPTNNIMNARINTPEFLNTNIVGNNQSVNIPSSSPAIPATANFAGTPNFNSSPQLANTQSFNQQPPGTSAFNNQSINPLQQQQQIFQQQQQFLGNGASNKTTPVVPTPSPPKKQPVKKKASKATTKKTPTTKTGSTPGAANSGSTPTGSTPSNQQPSLTGSAVQMNPTQSQLLRKEQEIVSKEEQSKKNHLEKRSKRLELFHSRPVDFFAASFAHLLELTDEENKIINDSGKKSNDSKVSKGLTPSTILQTPLTFSNAAKTPGSSSKTLGTHQAVHGGGNSVPGIATVSSYLSPKLSPNSKTEESIVASKWTPKVSKEAIGSAFCEMPEIKKLVFVDHTEEEDVAATILTPPPDESKKADLIKDEHGDTGIDEDRKFKKIKIDGFDFFDENDQLLDSDLMWKKDYVWSRFGA